MGKSTISMAIFNSKLLVYQRVATPAQILTFRPRNRFDMINPQPPSLPIKWLHHLDILYPEKTLFDTVWFNLSFISISSSVFSPFHLNQSPEKKHCSSPFYQRHWLPQFSELLVMIKPSTGSTLPSWIINNKLLPNLSEYILYIYIYILHNTA